MTIPVHTMTFIVIIIHKPNGQSLYIIINKNNPDVEMY